MELKNNQYVIKSNFVDYDGHLEEQAQDIVSERWDDLKAEVESTSVDLYEFFSDYVHEYADSEFIYIDLYDCALILDQADNVEEDYGLWDGVTDPQEALEIQAFFTYKNDLINKTIEKAKEELEHLDGGLEQDIEDLEHRIEGLESKIQDLEEVGQDETDEYDQLVEERDELEGTKEEKQQTRDNIETTLVSW